LPEGDVLEALRVVDTVVFTGSNANWTSANSHWVLPAAAWVEREGTYTNFEGRVQRFRTAIEPLGQALAEWEIVGRVMALLGESLSATRAEHVFRQLARRCRPSPGSAISGSATPGPSGRRGSRRTSRAGDPASEATS